MKHTILTAKTIVSLLGLLTSVGCGISAAGLRATQEAVVRPTVVTEVWQTAEAKIETAVPATLTAIAATRPATQKVALMSFHGRYVTALGEDGDWQLKQESGLGACGWFTQHYLDNGKIALVTCYDRYVTAPKTGATRWDWLLGQESELGDCGQFVLHESSDGVAFETCAGRFFTAGDGNWEGELAWSVVGETDTILTWELFTVLRR
jgi:hypothetical protein